MFSLLSGCLQIAYSHTLDEPKLGIRQIEIGNPEEVDLPDNFPSEQNYIAVNFNLHDSSFQTDKKTGKISSRHKIMFDLYNSSIRLEINNKGCLFAEDQSTLLRNLETGVNSLWLRSSNCTFETESMTIEYNLENTIFNDKPMTIYVFDGPQWYTNRLQLKRGRLKINEKESNLYSHYKYGFIHIYEGLDHLLFVFSLLLTIFFKTNKSVENTLLVKRSFYLVTTFTLSHSITLGLSYFNIIVIDNSLFIESMIVLSIIFAAIASIPTSTKQVPLVVVFLFGLFHGLGFANALTEFSSQQDAIISMVGFNLGVESGQILFTILTIPLFMVLKSKVDRVRWSRINTCLQICVAAIGIILLYKLVSG